jgi:hypothetical protein
MYFLTNMNPSTPLNTNDNTQHLVSMGFNAKEAHEAITICQNNISAALDYLNKRKEDQDPQIREAIQQSEQEYANKQAFGIAAQDIELSKVIEQSMNDNGMTAFEGATPEDRLRKSGIPVGLSNVGNSNIISSLLLQFIHPNLLYDSKIRRDGAQIYTSF